MAEAFQIPGPNMFMGNDEAWAFSGRAGRGKGPLGISGLQGWYEASGLNVSSDGAAHFNASVGEFLDLTDTSDLSMGPDQTFTIAFWIYFDTLGANRTPIFKGNSAADKEYRCYYSNGSAAIIFDVNGDSDGSSVTSSASISAGRWYFVVLEHDADVDTITIQVNDGAVASSAHSDGIKTDNGVFHIGSRAGSVDHDGRIDSVGVWTRTLTAAERTWLFNHSVGRKYADIGVANTGGSALKTSLSAWWDLDEVSGTRADSHASFNLTDNNTATSAAGVSSVAAQFTNATTEYLSGTGSSPGDADFTIACWVYLDNKTTNQAFLSKWNTDPNNEYAISYVLSADRFQFSVSDDGTATQTVDADDLGSPSAASWYFLVVWHDATADTINIQVNNGTADSAAHTTGIASTSAALRLGILQDSDSNPLDGRMALVGVWNRTLTASEKTWLYNDGDGQTYEDFDVTGTPGASMTTSLVSFWPLNEYSGTRADAHASDDLTDNATVTFNPGFQTALGEEIKDNSAISRWADLSANSRDLSQATQAARPTFQSNVVSGRAVVRFDGVDDTLQAETASDWRFLHDGTGYTVFIVAYAEDLNPADGERLICTQSASPSQTGICISRMDAEGQDDSVQVLISDSSGTHIINHYSADDLWEGQTWYIITCTYQEGIAGDDSSIWVDGGTADTSETTGATPDTGDPEAPLTVGATPTDTKPFQGDVAELIFYNSVLSADDRQDIERYLSQKYGITVT